MDKRKSNLPDLDLERLLNKGVAIACYEKEEAAILVECMLRDMPKHMLGWEDHDTHWNGEPTIYTLWYKTYINWSMASSNNLMQGKLSNHMNGGYTIIPFIDLIQQSEIEESDIPIEFLLR